ncbi:hypothetical protein RY27_03390 [Litorilinea aerophila]|nr:hypothetical protein RY27_03390 [Litorilinea aerophila]
MPESTPPFLLTVLRLLLAFLFALPVGLERELGPRNVGLRTFPLVAVTSCGFVLVGLDSVGVQGNLTARILQGLITGVGFIGGGAILKVHDTVHGTATAAAIWSTSAIGIAVAFGRHEIALVLALLNLLLLRLFMPLKEAIHAGDG